MPARPFDGGRYGRERCSPGSLARHRHAFGYICIVLSGRFVEAGDCGRFRLSPGDGIVHQPFEAHFDLFPSAGAEVLNLPLPDGLHLEGRLTIDDPDLIAGLAERDPGAAARQAARGRAAEAEARDWPDLLAADLGTPWPLALGEWARRHGLAPATVSRGFAKAYGTTPARYRAELRGRRAWQRLRMSGAPLAAIASDLGFADQAHMTRSVRSLTGHPPGRWRAA